jgi:hypothetical protein
MAMGDQLPPEGSRLLASLPRYRFLPASAVPVQSKVQQLLLFLSRPYRSCATLSIHFPFLSRAIVSGVGVVAWW